ncbi:hypothetical protein V6N11_002926 [Hibiscus sabdariffa]|uniref:NADH:ubiquinone oxidoreductase intermediate-associated protein 30 domain-containing protein n=1 Tax=Hibiscus sabdariffa TaxID=183260 RepID=A0ABR2SBT6_9ROSI
MDQIFKKKKSLWIRRCALYHGPPTVKPLQKPKREADFFNKICCNRPKVGGIRKWKVKDVSPFVVSNCDGEQSLTPLLQEEEMSRFRGIWQASLNATKKALTWNVEDWIPPAEKYIFNFSSKEELKKWHLYSDAEYGGMSSASLEIKDDPNKSSGVFSGTLSLDVNEGTKWKITRSGFCGMRSKKFDGFIDLEAYDTIALRLKGDGRCYISTIYTENWVNSPGQMEDNSWQSFVFVPKDNWYIAKIPLDQYLPTWRGNVIEAKLEMNPSRILGMSLSVNADGGVPGAESGPGDFKLEIDWIKALRTQ